MPGTVWITQLLFYTSKLKKFLYFNVIVISLDLNILMSIEV